MKSYFLNNTLYISYNCCFFHWKKDIRKNFFIFSCLYKKRIKNMPKSCRKEKRCRDREIVRVERVEGCGRFDRCERWGACGVERFGCGPCGGYPYAGACGYGYGWNNCAVGACGYPYGGCYNNWGCAGFNYPCWGANNWNWPYYNGIYAPQTWNACGVCNLNGFDPYCGSCGIRTWGLNFGGCC